MQVVLLPSGGDSACSSFKMKSCFNASSFQHCNVGGKCIFHNQGIMTCMSQSRNLFDTSRILCSKPNVYFLCSEQGEFGPRGDPGDAGADVSQLFNPY